MLKIFFWTLLAANLALFAYDRGYLDAVFPSGREPARMGNQLNADKIRLLPAAAVPAVPTSSAPAPAAPATRDKPDTAVAPASAAPATAGSYASAALMKVVEPAKPANPTQASAPDKSRPALACAEIGAFSAEEAKRFNAELAPLALGERVSQRPVQQTSYIVYIPSQGDKDGADRKLGELRRRGVTDFFIIQDDSPLRWGISLGVFRSEEAARQHLADLNQQGVRTARVGQRNTNSGAVTFRIRDVSADTRNALEKLKAAFPKQEFRSCTSA